MIKDIVIISKKEFAELKRTILKLLPMSILVLLPLVMVATNQGTIGNPLVSQKIIVTIFPSLLGGGICYELIRNNILLERREKMLDILLISNISKMGIVIGKAIPGVIVGTMVSILGNLILIYNIDYRNYFNYVSIITMPFVLYLFSILNLTINLRTKDEKIASFVAIFIMVGISILIAKMNDEVWALGIIVLIDIITTFLATRIKWVL